MKTRILDEPRFAYRSAGGAIGHCRLQAYAEPDRQTIVIATELADNPGASITNAAEHVAMAAWKVIARGRGFDASICYIEHYGPMSYRDGDREHECSVVRFTESPDRERLSAPAWTHIKPEIIRTLIGDQYADELYGIELASAGTAP